MTPEDREHLGAQQAELVRALTGRAEAPEGFDPGRVGATAEALRAKRAQSVVRAWPALARSLGDDFGPCFTAYAARSPVAPPWRASGRRSRLRPGTRPERPAHGPRPSRSPCGRPAFRVGAGRPGPSPRTCPACHRPLSPRAVDPGGTMSGPRGANSHHPPRTVRPSSSGDVVEGAGPIGGEDELPLIAPIGVV